MYPSIYSMSERAQHNFNQMLNRGARHRLMNKIRGRQHQLLDFEVVRANLEVRHQHDIGLKVVPVEAIVGSVGRTYDFDNAFHPISDDSRDRWCNVAVAFYSDKALPPVDLYKIDKQYFVIDGNHRISVFKASGQNYIEAHVIEIETVSNRCQTQEMPAPHYER